MNPPDQNRNFEIIFKRLETLDVVAAQLAYVLHDQVRERLEIAFDKRIRSWEQVGRSAKDTKELEAHFQNFLRVMDLMQQHLTSPPD